MNRHLKRLNAVEPAILATMPLAPELEAVLQRLADTVGIPPDELRQEAARIVWETRGMTDDERLAYVARDAGCSVGDLRRDMEAITH